MTTEIVIDSASASSLLTEAVEHLPEESASFLQESFSSYFTDAQHWIESCQSLKVTEEDQKEDMAKARAARLALREIRVKAEATRKSLKADSLRRGKAIDGIANVLKFLIVPAEDHLREQEQFALRKEQARVDELASSRAELIRPYGNPSSHDLGHMEESAFASLLEGLRSVHERKMEEARKAEEARLAKLKADMEARVAQEKLNKQLKEEAAKREEALRVEREKTLKLQRQVDRAKRKAQREKQQAEAEENERLRLAYVAEKAPDLEKARRFLQSITALPLPTFTTPEGIEISSVIGRKIAALVLELQKDLSSLER